MRLTAKMLLIAVLLVFTLLLCYVTVGFIDCVQASTPTFLYDVDSIFNQIKSIIILIFIGLAVTVVVGGLTCEL